MKRVFFILIEALLMLLMIVAGVAWFYPPIPNHPFFTATNPNRPLVIAHQGGDGLRPSNTMTAFANAVELGVDVLEMDIHSTVDGVLVIIHDDTVDRTTNGTGRVNDMTFAEIQQLDAGYHWPTLAEESHRTDRPYRGQGITIPALEEVLAAFPDMPMNIEIKQQSPSITQQLCDTLRAYDRTESTLVASFHPDVMLEFREACPEVATSGVEPEIRPFVIRNFLFVAAAYQPKAHAFQVPEQFGNIPVLRPRFIQNAQRTHNIAVHAWTINDAADIERVMELGVDGIITDYPDRMLEIRDNP